MKFDTVIRGGQIVVPKVGMIGGDLAVKNGKVAAIGSLSASEGQEVIDATGRYVMPGAIDPHVHLTLADSAAEFKTETTSAAFGGVTTVLYFVVGSKPYQETFTGLKETGEKQALVDFSFHFTMAAEEQLAAIEQYVSEFGISSFKLLMNFRGDEGKYVGVPGIDDGFMYALFEALRKFPHGVACVHTENIEVAWRLRKRLEGREDLMAWAESRPPLVEAEALYRAAYLAHAAGCSLYVVHVSSREALEAARSCSGRFGRIFVETCPHYLTYTTDSAKDKGTIAKVSPPLRSQEDVDSLWEAIRDGFINTIGSDHIARRKDKKAGSIWKASPGFPGVETLLPIMLSEGVNRRDIPLQRIAELTSYNAARIFNLYPRKGTLLPGSDADLVVVDLGMEKEVTSATLHSYCDFTLYEGQRIKGWPVLTMVRGNMVMRDGELVSSPGHGRFVAR